MVYLLFGQDNLSKELRLNTLKKELIPPGLQTFNLDVIYARETALQTLQERLLSLPVHSPRRMLVIKDAGSLKEECRVFLRAYCGKTNDSIALVLDFEKRPQRDAFFDDIARHAQSFSFKEEAKTDTFMLGRSIDAEKPDVALRILHELFAKGEKPERILGGLRYAWERDILRPQETRRKLKALLQCDVELKTGRLSAELALEKLVLGLCGFVKRAREA